MKRIVVIVGHSRTGTFCEALGEAYAEGARAAGHSVDLFVTSRLSFDPILRGAYVEVQPREPDLQRAYQALVGADHIVMIFPLWLGTLPAILKGFLERLLQPELVAAAAQHAFPQMLKGKSARIVITMGMPGFLYRWWFGAYALRMLKRNILGFIGAGPIRDTVFGNVEGVGDAGRRRWLAEIAALGRQAR